LLSICQSIKVTAAIDSFQQTSSGIVCLACRKDITNTKLLKTDVSAKVVPLLSKVPEEEYLQHEVNNLNERVWKKM